MTKMTIFIILTVLLLIRIIIGLWAKKRIFSLTSIPRNEYGIVFGAGLEKTGLPSNVLMERIQTAAMLYRAGKIRKVLLTGDDHSLYYNEPQAMKIAAMTLGISEKDILIDPNGHRSFDSCRNAICDFNIHQAVLITQPFHLPRVLWLAVSVGIDAIGMPVDLKRHRIDDEIWWRFRELFASVRAIIDGFIYKICYSVNEKRMNDRKGEIK